jgi:NADH-quinone oxidoreductase subunit J
MNLPTFLFLLIAFFTGLSAIAVVVSQNIVRSAIWLLFTLAGTSGIFFLLGADFVAATQLIIYVGGILVLVVFGVMLTAQGPFITMKVGAAEWSIATVVGITLMGVIATATLAEKWPQPGSDSVPSADTSSSSATLGQAFLGIKQVTPPAKLTGIVAGEGKLSARGQTTAETIKQRTIPERKQVAYLLPFEIVSVHLLVVLIGAAYLARAKRRKGATL